MRRSLLLVLTAGLLLSCQDADLPTVADSPDAAGAILDGTGIHGYVGDDPDLAVNPHFFWLPPVVGTSPGSNLGTADPGAAPSVRIVCWDSNQPGECDPDVPLVQFTVGDGLEVQEGHYHANFHVRDAGLRTSGGGAYTTYRILVLTPPLTSFGGPFVFGLADFQLGENGREAKSLSSDEMISLVDDRTLPINFRLDEGALEEELAANTAPTSDPTGQETFCQINCSVTVIDPAEATEASLTDPGTGDELTAMLIPAGAVVNTSETVVLVIDERRDDGDGEDGEPCLANASVATEACFRYELIPGSPEGDDFNTDVRFGVCPEGQAVSDGAILPTWRLLKADEDDGEVVVTRPEEVDVSDFLTCDVQTTPTLAVWDGPGGRLAGSLLQWLVPPVAASDFIGGQLRRLSDLFWGLDLTASVLSSPPAAAGVGTVVVPIVQFDFEHGGEVADGIEVTAAVTQGDGSILDPSEETSGQSLTLFTDEDGRVAVSFLLGATAGTNEVTITSDPPALGTPLVFQVQGVAGELELTDVDPASTTLVINGTGVGYTATIDNSTGSVQTDVVLQAWIEQGATRRAAGGLVVSCGGQSLGDVPPGTCSESFTYRASDQAPTAGTGTFTPGAAMAVFELKVGNVVVDEVRLEVTLQAPLPPID